jgi:hypothetical protein
MAFAEDHGTRIFDQILASGGLAHIAENIFDQLDGETLANCEEVSPIWRQFIVNNGVKLWKGQYLAKLAKPGSDAHRLINLNPKLFQFDHQANQGNFQIQNDRKIPHERSQYPTSHKCAERSGAMSDKWQLVTIGF